MGNSVKVVVIVREDSAVLKSRLLYIYQIRLISESRSSIIIGLSCCSALVVPLNFSMLPPSSDMAAFSTILGSSKSIIAVAGAGLSAASGPYHPPEG